MFSKDPYAQPGNTRKKILIISGVGLAVLMLIAALATVMTEDKSGSSGSLDKSKFGPSVYSASTAEPEMVDNAAFSLTYPKALQKTDDEVFEDQFGGLVSFIDGNDPSEYEIGVLVTDNESEYLSGEDAVVELVEEEVSNVQTGDVTVAGTPGKISSGEFTRNKKKWAVVYSHTKVGEYYVEFTAIYNQEIEYITDSINALLGSIKLK